MGVSHDWSDPSCLLCLQLQQSTSKPSECTSSPIMSGGTPLASMKPAFPSGTASPAFSASTAPSLFIDTTPPPVEDINLIVFCICFLLFLVVSYAFFLQNIIRNTRKNLRKAKMWQMQREETTYRRSSSDNQSVGNMVWLVYWGLSISGHLLWSLL